MDLSVRIGSLTLKNPLIAASGCFGYGVEYADLVDLSSLGGVAVKGLFLAEREGHPPPRIVETPAGMLNAIGLQGIGVRRFVDEKLPELRARRATVIVNVCGTTLDEYVEVSRILSDAEGVARHRAEHLVPEHQGRRHPVRLQPDRHLRRGQRRAQGDPAAAHSEADAQRHRRRVVSPAAAEEAGADAVSLVNTFLAMVIDVETRRPKISNVVGGLSGPAIRPIAVRMVYECRQAVKIPIIGMGGIADARDALEFMIAGATAVQVGTANFVDPFIWPKLLDGIADYMRAASHRAHRRSRRRASTSRGQGQGMDQLLVALDVETRRPRRGRSPTRCADASAGSRSAAGCSPATGRRSSRSSCRAAIACSST